MALFERALKGTGIVRRGDAILSKIAYTIHFTEPLGGQATVVEFAVRPPGTADGDRVHLTLEDGRVLTCEVLDESPYCAVHGDGPLVERRTRVRT
jgi:hypothetical protein